jgi:hypothetical protein
MLTSLLMMALAQTGAAPATAVQAEEPEIIVIGRRARAVRWDWRVDKAGRLTKCKITKSSGDREIDQIGCDATRRCAAQGIRQAKAMKACIVPVRRELIAVLADARAERRAREAGNAQD